MLAAAEAGTLTSGVSSVMGVVSTVMTTITDNPILTAFFVAPIIGVVIGVVRKLRAK
jgi:hypothetical protein